MIGPDGVSSLTADQQRALLQELLQQRSTERLQFPMSVQQQGLWYDYRRDPSSTAFNVFMPARIRSRLDVPAFHRSIDLLVQRHESLRTTFSDEGGELLQRVHEQGRSEFQFIDAEGQSDDQVRQAVIEQTARPFDLENDPMLRLTVFRRAADDWIIVAITHHIVVDFWSLILLLSEMREIYGSVFSDRPVSLSPAPNNYTSLVQQQRKMLDGPRGQSLRQYWQRQLEGVSQVTDLPTDFIRPQHFTHRADVTPLEIQGQTVARMTELAKQCGATFPALVLAVLQVLIHRYTGQSSFTIGSPFSGRLHRQYERTVGFFVNMLPLRADVSGDTTFAQFVTSAAQTLVEALEHEELPLTEIVRSLDVPREAARTPLFQVCCTFEKSHLKAEQGRAAYLFPAEAQRANFAGLEQESFSVPVQTCHYELEFVFERSDDALRGMICYCRDLFLPETMQIFADQFKRLAAQLVEHPSRPLADIRWTDESSENVPSAANDRDETPLLIHAIARHAATDPDAIALSSPARSWTRQELFAASDAIARALIGRGVGPGTYVPVVGHQGPGVIPALLGVIRAGAAVVPIDAAQPAVTPADLIEDTGARLVIVEDSSDWQTASDSRDQPEPVEVVTIDQLIRAGWGDSFPLAARLPDELCYLIYTSGSSGRPKGVMVEHGAIDNTLRWRTETVPVDRDDRVLVLLSHQFDAGFGLMLSSLVQGATLVWSGQPTSNVDAIVDLIIDESITVLPAIPTLMLLILHHPNLEQCQSLRQFWTGGEAMPTDLPQQFRERFRLPLWNFYGPTEAAVEATAMNVIDHDCRRVVPIGVPVSRTEILVLDANHRPLPPTFPGELAICGPGLARGYLGHPKLTAEKFPTLSDGRRVFLTGDRGRQRADGCFEFLGRTDHQVKLGGYRIELEEIEQVLRSCPAVADAAVRVHESAESPACLIASVTSSRTKSDDSDQAQTAEPNETAHEVRRFVAAQLPPYKRPRHYQVLDSLPKTSSGKIDRNRLPDFRDQTIDQPSLVPPRTPLEQHIADAWGRMLGISPIGMDQDFFELGGTSLQAAMLASQMSDDLEVHVPTSLLFDLADVSRLAERLVELHRDEMAIRFGTESVTIYASDASSSQRDASPHSLIAQFPAGRSKRQTGASDAMDELTPIFMIHPPGGIVVCYRELAQRCPDDQPFYAIRSRGLHGAETLPDTVQTMAADYIAAIKTVVPSGPYQLGGWSLGGIVAYEVTRQLLDAGETVERLILLDTAIPEGASDLVRGEENPNAGLEYGLELTLDELAQLEPDEVLPFLWQHAKNLGVLDDDTPAEVVDRALQDLQHLFHHHVDLVGGYKIEPLPVQVLLVRPRDVPLEVEASEDRGWSAIVSDLRVEFVAGHHHSMVQPPGVDEIAKLLA